jgi:hypothetical protein
VCFGIGPVLALATYTHAADRLRASFSMLADSVTTLWKNERADAAASLSEQLIRAAAKDHERKYANMLLTASRNLTKLSAQDRHAVAVGLRDCDKASVLDKKGETQKALATVRSATPQLEAAAGSNSWALAIALELQGHLEHTLGEDDEGGKDPVARSLHQEDSLGR